MRTFNHSHKKIFSESYIFLKGKSNIRNVLFQFYIFEKLKNSFS